MNLLPFFHYFQWYSQQVTHLTKTHGIKFLMICRHFNGCWVNVNVGLVFTVWRLDHSSPWTMMIHTTNTAPTDATMVGPRGAVRLTLHTHCETIVFLKTTDDISLRMSESDIHLGLNTRGGHGNCLVTSAEHGNSCRYQH